MPSTDLSSETRPGMGYDADRRRLRERVLEVPLFYKILIANAALVAVRWCTQRVRLWICAVVVTLSWPASSSAQEGSILGEVRSADGPVSGAGVELRRDTLVVARTVTDVSGRFLLLDIPAGPYRVEAAALGYGGIPATVLVEPGSVARVTLTLEAAPVSLEDVRVEGRRRRARFDEEAGSTVVELAGAEIERLPGLAEADVLRAVEVLPGVISTSDFSASFNVRGGAADQNLILLDGVPIYNPFHLGGVFGVFNADMVERTELLAGGFPARYGGRVSSVLNVWSDAGDGRPGVEAGVSLLASRVAVAGGLPTSAARSLGLSAVNARLSVRRSYFDVLFSPFFDFPYHLTDVQAVAQAWTENGVWTVTGYTGADVLDLRESPTFPLPLRLEWGNDVGGVGWSGALGRVRLDGRLSSSSFDTRILFPDFDDTRIGSRIEELRGALDLSVPAGPFQLGVGGELSRIGYENRFESGGTVFSAGDDDGWLSAGYGEVAWKSRRWLLELGARLDRWDASSTGASVEPAPRVAVKRFIGDGDAAAKIAVGRYTQTVHSLRDEEVPIGIDVWITAGARAPVVVSDQIQVGWEQFLDGWSGSIEGYYRTFDGVVTTNGADRPDDETDDLLVGSGRSWGADLYIRREPGPDQRVDGWITLSLLKAERTFPDPFAVESPTVTYAPIYDRRLDLDVVLQYPLPGGIDGGLRFNFGSGLPYTRPLAAHTYYRYDLEEGLLVPQAGVDEESPASAVVLGDRNAERYPPYHRLDMSFSKDYRTSWGTVRPFLNVLNVYDRRNNVLFYFFDYAASPPVRSGISMLPFLPTLGAEVKF